MGAPVVQSAAVPMSMVGAGGFEPPNTGSKVPRLSTWPRPSPPSRCCRLPSTEPIIHAIERDHLVLEATRRDADGRPGDRAHRPARPAGAGHPPADLARVIERAGQAEH